MQGRQKEQGGIAATAENRYTAQSTGLIPTHTNNPQAKANAHIPQRAWLKGRNPQARATRSNVPGGILHVP